MIFDTDSNVSCTQFIESKCNILPFNGLSQVAGCLCPGETMTYQCAVPSGTAATVWRGSTFSCTNNAIILHHNQIIPEGIAIVIT